MQSHHGTVNTTGTLVLIKQGQEVTAKIPESSLLTVQEANKEDYEELLRRQTHSYDNLDIALIHCVKQSKGYLCQTFFAAIAISDGSLNIITSCRKRKWATKQNINHLPNHPQHQQTTCSPLRPTTPTNVEIEEINSHAERIKFTDKYHKAKILSNPSRLAEGLQAIPQKKIQLYWCEYGESTTITCPRNSRKGKPMERKLQCWPPCRSRILSRALSHPSRENMLGYTIDKVSFHSTSITSLSREISKAQNIKLHAQLPSRKVKAPMQSSFQWNLAETSTKTGR